MDVNAMKMVLVTTVMEMMKGLMVHAVVLYVFVKYYLNTLKWPHDTLLKLQDCGGYAYGKNATEHASQGLFDDAAITVWRRGESVEVIWLSHVRHRGKTL